MVYARLWCNRSQVRCVKKTPAVWPVLNPIYKNLLHLNLSIEQSEHSRTHNQSPMYKFQLTEVPTHQQPPLQPLPFINLSPCMPMQQPMVSNNAISMFWCEGFYGGSTFYSGPVYQRMAPNQHLQHQYRPPSSGPSLNWHKKGSCKAEPPHPYQYLHESSGMAFYDCSTGVDPGHTRINASNNPGRGKVWRTLSKNPFMTDCD